VEDNDANDVAFAVAGVGNDGIDDGNMRAIVDDGRYDDNNAASVADAPVCDDGNDDDDDNAIGTFIVGENERKPLRELPLTSDVDNDDDDDNNDNDGVDVDVDDEVGNWLTSE
jgi:hypothetical protein